MGKNILLLVIMSGLGLLSCQNQELDYCKKQVPLVRGSVANALVALEPWTQKEGNRSLASVIIENDLSTKKTITQEILLSTMDRQSWKLWSEERMRDLRTVSKGIYGERSMKKLHLELNQISTEMMIFYGYAEQGRVDRMNESLIKLSGLVASLETQHCQ